MSNISNKTIDQGSSQTFTFTIKDSSNNLFDLTGYDARLQVRRTFGATSVLINGTLANGKLVLNTAASTVSWVITPADTTGIAFNAKEDDTLDCVYDLEIISPASKVYKPVR